MGEFEKHIDSTPDLNVSFGYQPVNPFESEPKSISNLHRNNSFSCMTGAAISANFTLANTNIVNGLIGGEILPELDSPNSFRRLTSSPSLSRLDLLSVSSPSRSSPIENSDPVTGFRSNSPTENFLNSVDVQTAGGAAGEDRVQAVCSEKDGFLFCGIYDGFNGRDAADFLAGTLYDNIAYYLYTLENNVKKQHFSYSNLKSELTMAIKISVVEDDEEASSESIWSRRFRNSVSDCLIQAVNQAETDFLATVEKEMEDRPDLVSVGSCVLVVLLRGSDLHVLNLGDSRAVLAKSNNEGLMAVQLTETHNVDDEDECKKLLEEHKDDDRVVSYGKIKGKLKVTRAIGVGYLKKRLFNDALMGILRVRDLTSPPYVHTKPHTLIHDVSEDDLFIILGSDGLFDFFTNHEVVNLVHEFIKGTPSGDAAKFLIDQLVLKAAEKAGFSTEELMNIPAGRRRKYHDDVTVIVILLGNKQQTLTASTAI